MSVNETLSRKLRGEAPFTDDISPDKMIYGYTLRSAIPKGTILSITIPSLPDGYICIDYKDIPGQNALDIFGEKIPYLAEKEVHYTGEPILLIGGPDYRLCRSIAEQITIKYREKKPHFSIKNIPPENIVEAISYSYGSFDDLKENTYRIIESTYYTGSQDHLSLEPNCAVSLWSEKSIIIYSSTLYPFHIRDNIAAFLGIPKKKVKIIVPDVCAPFGGKLVLPTIIAAHTSLLSYISKKPVKILYSRNEDIVYSFKRHPSMMTYKAIIDDEGNLSGMSADIVLDAGAYKLVSKRILKKAALSAFGKYNCENIKLTARMVKTNKVPSGYISGSGELQALFALELHTYKIAHFLKMDPYIWKKKNLSLKSPSFKAIDTYSPHLNVLDEVVKMSDYLRKYGAYEAIKKAKTPGLDLHMPLRGIGLALCPHSIGDFYAEEMHTYTIVVRLGKDRKCRIMTSLVDMGTSKSAYYAMIASQILNIHISEVIIEKVDTDRIPDTGPTISSRAVYVIGKYIKQACEIIKNKEKKKEYPIEVKKKIKLPIVKNKNISVFPSVITWESTVVEVEIDPVTFTPLCRGIWIVLDPGPVINYEIAREHVEASALQNLGHASLEIMEFKNGIVYQNNLSEYTIPDMSTTPEIHVSFINNEEEHKNNPVRGLGDQAVMGVSSAYISAILQATNCEQTSIPCTQEMILKHCILTDTADTITGNLNVKENVPGTQE